MRRNESDTSERYLNSVRLQIVNAAQAMLDSEITYLVGAGKLAALRHEAKVENDEDFMVFVAIDSDTDHLPLGPVREFWDSSALEKLQPKIDEAEAWAKAHAESACVKLVARFS